MPQSDLVQTIATATLTTSLALAISLPLLQMDAVSRKLLSPESLRAKRRKTQLYEMDKAVEIQRLKGRSAVQGCAAAGGTGGGKGSKKKADGSTWHYSPKEDRIATSLLVTAAEYEVLKEEIMDKKRPSPYVVAIDRDEDDGLDRQEIYLWLAFPPTEKSSGGDTVKKAAAGEVNDATADEGGLIDEWRRVQVPLVPFCTLLAAAFEDQMSSTALCFLTDASSGLAARVVGAILEADGGDASSNGDVKEGAAKGGVAGVAMVKEPSWMVIVARVLQRNLIQRDNVAKVVFALTRMEAWRVRDRIGKSRTVVFTLPGQATTPTLLPILYQAFPHERHVFAYDTCFESVARGLMLRKTSVKLSGLMLPSVVGGGGNSGSGDGTSSNAMVESALQMPQWVTSTVPVTQLKSIRKLGEALADLPADQAGIVEAWMASVDAFLQLKENEKRNNYTPFVCRMGLIMGRTGLGNFNADRVEELNELALVNLLQYVTGSRSRPLKPEVVTAAKKSLEDVKAKCVADVGGYHLEHEDKKLLEACCFLHHGILIGDKTLMDTVQPQKEWSLKAARKLQSCACCDPEEEEGSEDEMDTGGSSDAKDIGKADMAMPGAFATGLNKRVNASGGSDAPAAKKKPGYVDGKAAFAFDPTKF